MIEVECWVGNAFLPLVERHCKLTKRHHKGLACNDVNWPRPCLPGLHVNCLDFAKPAIKLQCTCTTCPPPNPRRSPPNPPVLPLGHGSAPSPSLDQASFYVFDIVRANYGRLDEAQMKLIAGGKGLGRNFYGMGDRTRCCYFELDDLRVLFVDRPVDDVRLELLELDYVQ